MAKEIQGELLSVRASIVKEMSSDPRYAHAVYGAQEGTLKGHHVIALIGENASLTKFASADTVYEELFLTYDEKCIPFQARVAFKGISSGVLCKLSFNDFSQDERIGSHTDYSLFILKSEKGRLVPILFNDPSILIDVFELVFPKQVHGRITMDPNWEKAYDRWAEKG